MIRLLVAALLLVSCRTRPLEPADLATPHDLAGADLASVDLITSASRDLSQGPCGGLSCDEATELCVFLNRGDCSRYECVPIPAGCSTNRTCGCVGSGFCPGLEMQGETLKCTPNATFPPGIDIVCTSTIQCV